VGTEVLSFLQLNTMAISVATISRLVLFNLVKLVFICLILLVSSFLLYWRSLHPPFYVTPTAFFHPPFCSRVPTYHAYGIYYSFSRSPLGLEIGIPEISPYPKPRRGDIILPSPSSPTRSKNPPSKGLQTSFKNKPQPHSWD